MKMDFFKQVVLLRVDGWRECDTAGIVRDSYPALYPDTATGTCRAFFFSFFLHPHQQLGRCL